MRVVQFLLFLFILNKSKYITHVGMSLICVHRFKDSFTIIPILVGSLSPDREALYGRLLAPYMADPQTLFVISSDFCHWGQRFRYTYYDRSCGPIHRSIQNLDKMVYIYLFLRDGEKTQSSYPIVI